MLYINQPQQSTGIVLEGMKAQIYYLVIPVQAKGLLTLKDYRLSILIDMLLPLR
jgi:hypothetical protein